MITFSIELYTIDQILILLEGGIMRKVWWIKTLGLGIAVLFFCTGIAFGFNVNLANESKTMIGGNTLYVGGSGPGNYSRIQYAINVATDGDTVFVYDDSSPYNENVIVNKSIALIGEDKQTTVISGASYNNASVRIKSDGVTLQKFTLTNTYSDGIQIKSNNCTIQNNIITGNNEGIDVFKANNTLIEGNIISNNLEGLYIASSKDTVISGNILSFNTYHGINLGTDQTLITLNNISDNGQNGVMIGGDNNTILQNNIINNGHFGVSIWNSKNDAILKNNIYNNRQGNARIHVDLWIALLRKPFNHTWDGNYWGRPYQHPKAILGVKYLILPSLILQWFVNTFIKKPTADPVGIAIFIPVIKYDQNPAQEPYNIPIEAQ